MKPLLFSTAISALISLSALAFAGGDATPGLEESIGSDERERMHRELDKYSNKAYPDSEAIEERRQKMRERLLWQSDQYGHGNLSREEAELRMPKIAKHFDEIDTDNDGSISREEMRAAQDKMRALREHYEKREAELAAAAVAPPAKKQAKRRPKPAPPPAIDIEQENGEPLVN